MFLQVSDFICIAEVTTKAIQALNSSRGSKSEFRSLLNTFIALRQAAFQAEALCTVSSFDYTHEDKGRSEHLNSVACAITKEREECQMLIDKFSEDFSSYEKAFAEEGTGKLHQGLRSLTWVVRKEEITTVEKRLNGHLQALQLHLCCFYYATVKIDVADNAALLGSIDSSMGMLTTGFNDMQLKMSEALTKLDVFQNCVPMAIGYCWGPEPPILLLDGLGRKMSLPMMLASSPDIFRDVLLIMHRGGPGYHKIENGKYVVSDEDCNGALISRDKWLDSFQPGRRIALSFLLKHPATSDEKQCPKCKTLKTWPDVHPGQRRCLKCHLTFKIEDRERTRLFWKDLKKRPRPPERHSSPSAPQKSKETTINRPLIRNKTLPPEQYVHPYHRVHYQRDIAWRVFVEQPWHKTDPEFKEFLTALPPLHRAAATGDIEKLDELLENRGNGNDNNDVNWKVSDSLYRHDRTGWDFTGAPPIHFAAYYGHFDAVVFLLAKGATIDAKDAAGTTALHAAAWTGNERLFQTLLKKGADSSIHDYDGWSVTIYAMSQGHDSILRLLLENPDGDPGTLVKRYKLRHAAKLGSDTVLDMLLEDQATGEDDRTREMLFAEALGGAAEGGHLGLVQRLLDKNADPATQDGSGSTPLHWAVWGGHTEIGNLMYNEKNKVDNRDGRNKDAPTELRLTSGCHESVIQMLIDKGAAINAQNSQGCTPLHWVSGAGSAPMIQCLLNNNADVHVVDKYGRTAIDRAIETGDDSVIKQLQFR